MRFLVSYPQFFGVVFAKNTYFKYDFNINNSVVYCNNFKNFHFWQISC